MQGVLRDALLVRVGKGRFKSVSSRPVMRDTYAATAAISTADGVVSKRSDNCSRSDAVSAAIIDVRRNTLSAGPDADASPDGLIVVNRSASRLRQKVPSRSRIADSEYSRSSATSVERGTLWAGEGSCSEASAS